MRHHDRAPLGALTFDPSPLCAALRALAVASFIAALAACAEQGDPIAPARWPAVEPPLAAGVSASPSAATADAIDRILPALEADAAAFVGSDLRALDATLRDPRATAAAKARAAAAAQRALARFTGERPDAADLDALRLELDAVSATLW